MGASLLVLVLGCAAPSFRTLSHGTSLESSLSLETWPDDTGVPTAPQGEASSPDWHGRARQDANDNLSQGRSDDGLLVLILLLRLTFKKQQLM